MDYNYDKRHISVAICHTDIQFQLTNHGDDRKTFEVITSSQSTGGLGSEASLLTAIFTHFCYQKVNQKPYFDRGHTKRTTIYRLSTQQITYFR